MIGLIVWGVIGIIYFFVNYKKLEEKVAKAVYYYGDVFVLVLIILCVVAWPIMLMLDNSKKKK